MTFIIFKDELSILLDVLKEKFYTDLSIIVETTKSQSIIPMYQVTFINSQFNSTAILLAVWRAGYLHALSKNTDQKDTCTAKIKIGHKN